MTSNEPTESIEIGVGPAYVSYSSFTGWLKCGKQWELKRIHHVQEKPGWALVGGSALHAATEVIDRQLWEQGVK